MASHRSFLPVVQLCDNFSLPASHPAPSSALASFCVTSDLTSAVGLLHPRVTEQLLEDNKRVAEAGRQPSWGVVHHERTGTKQAQAVRAVYFSDHLSDRELRTVAIDKLCRRWREECLFPDVIGGRLWRSELYSVYADPFGPFGSENVVFDVERAAAALFGVVTYGIHMTLYVPPSSGSKEEMKIWVSTRSKTKQEWPGYLDSCAGGAVPSGLTPFETMIKEAGEEANLGEHILRKYAHSAGAISYFFQTELGWLRPEVEFIYEVAVPSTATSTTEEQESFQPKPLDGEVQQFQLLPLSEVIERLHNKLFKPNCGVVLVDFFIRHGVITPENEPNYLEIMTRLHSRFHCHKW